MRAEADRISGQRGDSLLFADVSFVLTPGEALVVTGPNGAGKSTLLRVLAGLLQAESGRFTLTDTDGAQLNVAEGAHYLGHRNAMKRELTVAENLDYWKRFLPGGREPGLGVEEAIAAVELSGVGHLPFGYLSAGQQRRIALARLLCTHRQLWLLDEPTAALDSRSDTLFAEMVRAHLARGGLAVVATHQPLGLDGVRSLRLDGIHPANQAVTGWSASDGVEA